MAYGKLGTIKICGEHPEFAILDDNGVPETPIPSMDAWLMKRLGHTVSLTFTDKYFQVADLDKEE